MRKTCIRFQLSTSHPITTAQLLKRHVLFLYEVYSNTALHVRYYNIPRRPSFQDESISMNIKLKNLRSAEEDLGKFLGNVVVTSELATSICGDEVNDTYLEYVIELNNKVTKRLLWKFVVHHSVAQWPKDSTRCLRCRETCTPLDLFSCS